MGKAGGIFFPLLHFILGGNPMQFTPPTHPPTLRTAGFHLPPQQALASLGGCPARHPVPHGIPQNSSWAEQNSAPRYCRIDQLQGMAEPQSAEQIPHYIWVTYIIFPYIYPPISLVSLSPHPQYSPIYYIPKYILPNIFSNIEYLYTYIERKYYIPRYIYIYMGNIIYYTIFFNIY